MNNTNTRLYYYRPIAALPGVFKCAGFGAEIPAHRAFYEPYFAANANPSSGLAAGKPIIREYSGDRITADGATYPGHSS